jgi:hypothetical protein
MQAIRLYSTGVDVNAAVAALPSNLHVVASSPQDLGYKELKFSAVDGEQQLWLRNEIVNKLVDAVDHAGGGRPKRAATATRCNASTSHAPPRRERDKLGRRSALIISRL